MNIVLLEKSNFINENEVIIKDKNKYVLSNNSSIFSINLYKKPNIQ